MDNLDKKGVLRKFALKSIVLMVLSPLERIKIDKSRFYAHTIVKKEQFFSTLKEKLFRWMQFVGDILENFLNFKDASRVKFYAL